MPVMRLRRGGALLAAGMALVVAVGACTSDDDAPEAVPDQLESEPDDEPDEPPPPAGLRVAVVLPDDASADEAVLDQMALDVHRIDAIGRSGIAEVRPIRPGAAEFVPDLAWALAERQTDLICLLGRGNRALAAELATLYPHLAFCAAPLPLNTEVPDAVQVLDIRGEELGYVVGVAAAGAAAGEPIGVVLGTEAMARGAFRDGLTAAVSGLDVIQVTVDEELDAVAAVQQVLDEGAEVVVLDSVIGASDALEHAADHALVLSPDVLARGSFAEQAVMTWRVHWDVIVRRALDRVTGAADRTPSSHGFPEGVFSVTMGEAVSPALRAQLARVVGELQARQLDPLDPADVVPPDSEDGPPTPTPGDDVSDDDEDGDGDGGDDGDGQDGDASDGDDSDAGDGGGDDGASG